MLWRYKMQTFMDVKELWGLINMTEVKLKEEDVVATITYTKKDLELVNSKLVQQSTCDYVEGNHDP